MDATAEQLLLLSKKTRDAANALSDYLFANWERLDPSERTVLQSLFLSLITASGDLNTHSVDVRLGDGEHSLLALQKIVDEAHQALDHIADVKKAIGVAASLIALTTAISTGNPGAIVATAKALKEAAAPAPVPTA